MRFSAVVLLFGTAIPAFAGEAIEASVTDGGGIYYGEEQNYNYNSIGGSLQWYLTDHTAIESKFSLLNVNGGQSGTLYWARVGSSHDFLARKRVTPSWFWDVGFAKVVGTVHPPSPDYYATVGVGLSVKYYLSDRVFIAPRIRAGFFLNSIE